MSAETLSLIQNEIHEMRKYFTQQEMRIQELITTALAKPEQEDVKTLVDNDKLKELQEALDKSKAAARSADGKIKLLQYQLAKAKASSGATVTSETTNHVAPTTTKKVSFEDEVIQAASHDWLRHWLKMKPICRDILVTQSTETVASAETEELEPKNEDAFTIQEVQVNIELEISRCSEMGNMLDELGVLSESFALHTQPALDEEEHVAEGRETEKQENEIVEDKNLINKDVQMEDNLIPMSFCAKLFSPVSTHTVTDTKSVQTATSKYDEIDIQSSSNSTAASGKVSPASTACSLREYLEMKKNANNRESPCSVIQAAGGFSPAETNPEQVQNMTLFSPQSNVGTIKSSVTQAKSLVSPSEMKLLFQGFQAASTSTNALVTDTPAPTSQSRAELLLHSAETVSSLGHSQLTPSVFQSALKSAVKTPKNQLFTIHSASTKKSMKSQASDMKTISRLLDCGSSFTTENTDERDISCHTLTTEFDLLHNYRAPSYEQLKRRIIDVEQPLMSAKLASN